MVGQVAHGSRDTQWANASHHNSDDLISVEQGLLRSLELVLDGGSNVVDVLVAPQLTTDKGQVNTAKQSGSAIGEGRGVALAYI
jgi:hypothetical protein